MPDDESCISLLICDMVKKQGTITRSVILDESGDHTTCIRSELSLCREKLSLRQGAVGKQEGSV